MRRTTGHTLRLLSFPGVLEKGLNRLMRMRAQLGGMLAAVQSMLGASHPLPVPPTASARRRLCTGIRVGVQSALGAADRLPVRLRARISESAPVHGWGGWPAPNWAAQPGGLAAAQSFLAACRSSASQCCNSL